MHLNMFLKWAFWYIPDIPRIYFWLLETLKKKLARISSMSEVCNRLLWLVVIRDDAYWSSSPSISLDSSGCGSIWSVIPEQQCYNKMTGVCGGISASFLTHHKEISPLSLCDVVLCPCSSSTRRWTALTILTSTYLGEFRVFIRTVRAWAIHTIQLFLTSLLFNIKWIIAVMCGSEVEKQRTFISVVPSTQHTRDLINF